MEDIFLMMCSLCLFSFSQALVSAFRIHQLCKTTLWPHFCTLFVYQALSCHFTSQYIDF